MDRSSGNITKLFVSNLPEGCTPWELRKGLERFGAIYGTYVAKKRDKLGCRFGFVSFVDIKDRKDFVKSLSGVKLGENKLRINVARFAVENSGEAGQPEIQNRYNKATGNTVGGKPFVLRDARSYREVVGNSSGGIGAAWGQETKLSEAYQEPGKYVVVPDRTCAFNSLNGVALVGRTLDLETLVDFDKLLNIAKITVASIQYLGGLSLLISFHDKEAANKFLDLKVVWGPWFSRLDPWTRQSLPFERVAWLRLSGIPLHLFEPDVMIQVGELFGKVLHAPKFVEEDLDVSVCSIGVLVGESSRIHDSVDLRWKSKSYRIWVEEEHEVWVPDCLDSSGSVGTGSEMHQPVENHHCSGIEGIEESLEKAGRKEDEKSKGGEEVFSHADHDPMHEERENGGRFDFEVGDTMHVNMGNNHNVAQEVGPEKVDKVEVNKGVNVDNPLGVSRIDSGGPSGPGFILGIGDSRRSGFKKPKILAQPRKDNGRCLTPTELRPKKRSRLLLDEEFSFSPPPQCPGTNQVEAQIPVVSNSQIPVPDLNHSVGEGASSETLVKDSLESEVQQLGGSKGRR
ncbi:putative RNA recognition motif domain, nucleotide-binding alpha-beta plait domain superfamily [Helianthus annuus]|uniref:RNA recognition motif domain, nucleotide-binding alpha-beta plait domain superfamily n=1 Tax=Helianthus annuus TaxID=4232 RepID=A0A9K3E1X1_HELAN|nr:putative RNA recognition motif domain, nucleotide-binding alpha-beta plait domain superfamily [Helianthus annuus]KAJ0456760.1 putative RNA recognition motif domain, nucleotide-binding alpha-beta plait domain superfamily [Helianthus annuus]KAJ0473911.1 putative RNA recognition motif domain, nucleotide-binding alpha-beta plait domain superfamily [Helianthus annuus]KAJ0649486.1 putative RNA recognition motif domain, nucleotide-binding alpha-beta plait domain superfamily [Helianthus annuus]KAJ06